jgi:hypothetical protein
VSKRRLTGQHVEDGVKHVPQFQAEDFKWLVPLSIPMAVGEQKGPRDWFHDAETYYV